MNHDHMHMYMSGICIYIYTYIFIYVEQFMYKCVQYIFTVWFSVFIRVGLWFIQDLLRVYLGLV